MASLRELGERTGAIAEVRGRGLMIAAELVDPRAQEVAAACLEQGLVINAIGERIVRFLPPLVCTTAETAILIDTLEAVLGAA
jgi:4-aminobutyrate aminotransferase-like enzyme